MNVNRYHSIVRNFSGHPRPTTCFSIIFVVNLIISHCSLLLADAQITTQSSVTTVSTPSIDRISLSDFEHPHSSVRELDAFGNLSIALSPLRVDTRFVLLQVHSQTWNVTLSYDRPGRPTRPGRFIQGQNVGLIRTFSNTSTVPPKITWLHVSNPNNRSVQVLLLVSEYSHDHAVPGGCNLEFPVRIAPFLRLQVNDLETVLDFQRAAILSDRDDGSLVACDEVVRSIDYRVYYYFLAEGDYSATEYMAGMQRMSTVQDIERYAELAVIPSTGPHTRLRFLTYHGKGVVYNVVATHGGIRTAYVPVATYSCDLSNMNSCRQRSAFLQAWTLIVVSLVGFLICYKGVRLHELQFLLFTFVLAFLISFILVARFTRFGFIDDITTGIVIALAVTGLFFGLWLRYSLKLVIYTVNAMLTALILSNFILFVGLGDLDQFKVPLYFWLYQIFCQLLVILSFGGATKTMHALSGSFVGSYLFIITFEKIVNGSLIYVLVNFVRRAVYDRLYQTQNEIPFQSADFINTCVWALLCLTGVLYQSCQKADVEPPTDDSIERTKRNSKDVTNILAQDRDADIERYNQLTRAAGSKGDKQIESSTSSYGSTSSDSSSGGQANGDAVIIDLPGTPNQTRLRARLASPAYQSTPKSRPDIRDNTNLESSPSKKLRTPNPERLSLLRSPIVNPLNRSNYNAI